MLLPESLAIAAIAEAGIGTSWRVNGLGVSAVCAVFLTSNLAQEGLTGWANPVHHPVLELVTDYSVSNDRNFLLRQSNRLHTSWTVVTAYSSSCSSLGRMSC